MPRLLRQAKATKLTIAQILTWADAFHERYGRWPNRDDRNRGLVDSTWAGIDQCLKGGHRGLKPGSSLAKLLLKHRGRRHKQILSPLSTRQVLHWADQHHKQTGTWPHPTTGPIREAPGETWAAINAMLICGGRSLPGGMSLAQLLAAHRGVRNVKALPPLSIPQILEWIRTHHRQTGQWPNRHSGTIDGAPGERWSAVDSALLNGNRGLSGGSTLVQLLTQYFGVRTFSQLGPLTRRKILQWADQHFRLTEKWPTADSGAIADTEGEDWSNVEACLYFGRRGFPGGDTLARFLARHRGKRNLAALQPLNVLQILAWADAHHEQSGVWPQKKSGLISGTEETWNGVHRALSRGGRGLPGGTTLAQLLEYARGVRNLGNPPRLTIKQILEWADEHHAKTGQWPKATSGVVEGVNGETWSSVNSALLVGRRGLKGGLSLANFLTKYRGVRHLLNLPRLNLELILSWADSHKIRTGSWPKVSSGEIVDSPGLTWSTLDMAMRTGCRGLPGNDSLARLLDRSRNIRKQASSIKAHS